MSEQVTFGGYGGWRLDRHPKPGEQGTCQDRPRENYSDVLRAIDASIAAWFDGEYAEPEQPKSPISPYANVRWDRGRWRCSFWHEQELHTVGSFDNPHDAARAYNRYIKRHGLMGIGPRSRKLLVIVEGAEQ